MTYSEGHTVSVAIVRVYYHNFGMFEGVGVDV